MPGREHGRGSAATRSCLPLSCTMASLARFVRSKSGLGRATSGGSGASGGSDTTGRVGHHRRRRDSDSSDSARSRSISPPAAAAARTDAHRVSDVHTDVVHDPSFGGYVACGLGEFRYLQAEDVDDPVVHRACVELNFEECVKGGMRRHEEIINAMCEAGLSVDVLTRGLSTHTDATAMHGAYLILLVRASDVIVDQRIRAMEKEMWRRHGNVSGFEFRGDRAAQEARETNAAAKRATPAEEIEVINHIITEGARVREDNPCVERIFPLHDRVAAQELVLDWIRSLRNPTNTRSSEFVEEMRRNFGEKVAYYFAYSTEFNVWLAPVALLGVCVSLIRDVFGVITYMRALPLWGFFVCCVWAFSFLKSWARRASTLQFEWGDTSMYGRETQYPRPQFKGYPGVDPVTGEPTLTYPEWKRWPKYLFIQVFLIANISLLIVATVIWASVYEALKVQFPVSGIFTVQWFAILAEGICLGLFVDTFQWTVITKFIGNLFTRWENYATEAEYERALIVKLFFFDMCNYFTWFMVMAFVYVQPHMGDKVTNLFNSVLWKDPSNCCFGPYLQSQDGNKTVANPGLIGSGCNSCPDTYQFPNATCVPCNGPFQFNKNNLDLTTLFMCPVVVTQSINMLLSMLVPYLLKTFNDRRRRKRLEQLEIERRRGSTVKYGTYSGDDSETESRATVHSSEAPLLIGDSQKPRRRSSSDGSEGFALDVASKRRMLDGKARGVLEEGDGSTYDPYDDYHLLGVFFFFVTAFSIIWPVLPLCVLIFNLVKSRVDGYRLCYTCKRPVPRRASGIGQWLPQFYLEAYGAMLLNVAFACFSIGALEFYSPYCVQEIERRFADSELSYYLMGPDYECMGYLPRLVTALVMEHLFIVVVSTISREVNDVPKPVRNSVLVKEVRFKMRMLEALGTSRACCVHHPATEPSHPCALQGFASKGLHAGVDAGIGERRLGRSRHQTLSEAENI